MIDLDALAEHYYSSSDPQFQTEHKETEEEKEERKNDLLDGLAEDIANWDVSMEDSYNYYCLKFKDLSFEEFKAEMEERV